MTLSCYCEDGDFDWYWWAPDDYTQSPPDGRRKRCKSCGDLIDHEATITKFRRTRYAEGDIEARIYGDEEPDVPMADWWLCEQCSDLYWSLEELGFCISPASDMRALVKEYAKTYAKAP